MVLYFYTHSQILILLSIFCSIVIFCCSLFLYLYMLLSKFCSLFLYLDVVFCWSLDLLCTTVILNVLNACNLLTH